MTNFTHCKYFYREFPLQSIAALNSTIWTNFTTWRLCIDKVGWRCVESNKHLRNKPSSLKVDIVGNWVPREAGAFMYSTGWTLWTMPIGYLGSKNSCLNTSFRGVLNATQEFFPQEFLCCNDDVIFFSEKKMTSSLQHKNSWGILHLEPPNVCIFSANSFTSFSLLSCTNVLRPFIPFPIYIDRIAM